MRNKILSNVQNGILYRSTLPIDIRDDQSKNYHILAPSSHLVLSSAVGSQVSISGNLWIQNGLLIAQSADETGVNIGGTFYSSSIAIHVEGTDDPAELLVHRHSNNVNFGGHLVLARSRGTDASESAVQSGDRVGRIACVACDGTNYQFIGQVDFVADGNITPISSPGRISFFTTPTNSISEIERIRIDSNGQLVSPNQHLILSSSVGSIIRLSGALTIHQETTTNLPANSTPMTGTILWDSTRKTMKVYGPMGWTPILTGSAG